MRFARNRHRGGRAGGEPRARRRPWGFGLGRWHDRWHQLHDRHHADHQAPGLGKRLLVTYVLASTLSILVAGLLMKGLLEWYRPVAVTHGLRVQAGGIASRLRFGPDGRPLALAAAPAPDAAWVYGAAPREWKFRVIDDRGAVVVSSDPGAGPIAPPAAGAAQMLPAAFDFVADSLPLHAVTQDYAHDGRPFRVQAAISDRAASLFVGVFVAPMLKSAMWIGTISLVLFAIGMHFTLGYLLRPLREASAAASRIDPRNLQARLASSRMPRELRPLMAAFNAALDRLEKGYRTQQEFLASAAHELKTPLALMRGEVELGGAGDRATLLRDIDLMARQVHQLLHLAEASETRNYAFEAVDIGAVAGEAADLLSRLAQRADVHIHVRHPAAPAVRPADRGAVFVLVKNLVENAIQHSPPGGVVTVAVDARGVAVRDEGPGIPAAHLDKLFTRFWRGPGRRDTGAGLGLAICAEVALAHGWAIAARAAEPGGAEFAVTFAGAPAVPGA